MVYPQNGKSVINNFFFNKFFSDISLTFGHLVWHIQVFLSIGSGLH